MAKKNKKNDKKDPKKDEHRISPVTKKYREAIGYMDKGDLVRAVRGFLKVLEDSPESEEAYFAETQIKRLLRVYPEQMKEASFDAQAFAELQAKRRTATAALDTPTKVLIGFVFVAAAWMALLFAAPGVAMLGRGPEVPWAFRILGMLGAMIGTAIGFGMRKQMWESVTFFIIWIPPLLILTFIGVVESFKNHGDGPDILAGILTVIALAAEVVAAWYVSKFSHRFVY